MAITGLAAIVLGTVGAIVGVFVAIGSAAVSGAAMVISGMLRIVGAIAGMVAKVLGIPPIFSSALSAAAGVVQGFAGSFMAAGVGLISALVEGIKSKVGEIKAAVEEALSAARALLPFSDAKEGPFRDLTYSGGQLMATIAKGVLGNAEAVPSAMSQVFIPAMGMTPPTPMNAQAAAGGTTTNNSSNSPITVNFQLSSGGDGQGIMAQIRANQGEIVRIIESATARRDRTRYSNA